MIICHSRKYVFIHIHKTAGESITQALSTHLTRADLTLGTTPGGKLANWIKLTPIRKHSTARAVRAHLKDELWRQYFKFAFVRHPVDRAVSLYAYYGKMLRRRAETSVRNTLYILPGAQARDPLQWPATRAYRETGSFSDFIRHPEFSPRHAGTRPQWESVCDPDGAIIVDFIGKFETLEADFLRVLDRIGLGPIALPKRNMSRADAPDAPPDPVSALDRAHLAEMYRRDFELFGYAASDPVRT